jgi:hypothetical protein
MAKLALALMNDTGEELFPVLDQFEIPASLRQFDVVVSDVEIRKLGEDAFLRWLHYQMKNRTVPVRKSAVPLACEEPETLVEYAPGRTVETTFHPDAPVAEDYVHGENDMLYAEDAHIAKVQTLLAQKDCGKCPLAKACLDVSIIHAPADGVFGVWGGHNENTRRLIQNRFNKLRRAYSSTKTNDMTEEQREVYREMAAALKFTA